MNTYTYTPTLRLEGPFAATIGFFDGLHLGHRHLLKQLSVAAAERGQRTLVVTFDRHPRQTLQPSWTPQLLTTLDERRSLLDATAVDTLVVLPFTESMARLTAHEFMSAVLRDQLDVATLLTGYDNRFGTRSTAASERTLQEVHAAAASPSGVSPFDDYRRYGATIGLDVLLAEPLIVDGAAVSSSRVRRLLSDGDVAAAARCLGRPYTLAGTVVHGEQVGRTLGFPTANVQCADPLKLIPRPGVYAVTVLPSPFSLQCVDGFSTPSPSLSPFSLPLLPLPALMNIGTRPTFGHHGLTLEAHLLDFSGDLYGMVLQVDFIERLRDEQHFPSAEALARQMQLDATAARRIFQQASSSPSFSPLPDSNSH